MNGIPLELVEPEILRFKIFEPILLLGRAKFAGVDIRVRVKGGGHVSQIYGAARLGRAAPGGGGSPLSQPSARPSPSRSSPTTRSSWMSTRRSRSRTACSPTTERCWSPTRAAASRRSLAAAARAPSTRRRAPPRARAARSSPHSLRAVVPLSERRGGVWALPALGRRWGRSRAWAGLRTRVARGLSLLLCLLCDASINCHRAAASRTRFTSGGRNNFADSSSASQNSAERSNRLRYRPGPCDCSSTPPCRPAASGGA